MKKYFIFLTTLLLALPIFLEAKYHFDETIHIPFQEQELSEWKIGYQNTKDAGISSTRYVLQNEDMSNWTKLINIQFKDRGVLKTATAAEAMAAEAAQSYGVTYKVHAQHQNDIIYERTFPSGEHEIVRMIMTKKGLHRAAFIKKKPFDDSERNQLIHKLSSGVIGGRQ